MATLVITSDYLHMCQGQAYDIEKQSVLFPKNCNEARDELSRASKNQGCAKNRAFGEAYENLAEKPIFQMKLQIVCPKQTNDLVAEGRALHHCVGTYIERVAEKNA